MFNRHYQGRRPTNKVFVIFRICLSMFMFAVLLMGLYSAYKYFSGLDPLKLDLPRTPKQLTEALSSLKIDPKILGKSIQLPKSSNQPSPDSSPFFKFLVIADSHANNDNLQKAINQVKQNYPDLKFIIGLGDYSEVGTVAQLKTAKDTLDTFSLRYFLIPGDHDLWDCRDKNFPPTDCFKQVFGPNYQAFVFDDFKFMLLDNSDDYKGLEEAQLQWVESELEKAKEESLKGIFVFLHEPLFHPSSDHVMGKVESSLKQQARDLMFQFKTVGVKKVFAGDTHYFSEYSEPVTGLPMVTVGAIAAERNPQVPRFAVVSVFEDGLTKVDDVEIR